MRVTWFLMSVLTLGGCVSVDHQHHSTETSPPPGSNLMLRAPITISDGLEVIISDVVIPPGATVPRHFHPGEEFVYVIQGSAVHVEQGKPDQVLQAGDGYVIPPEAEHAPRGGPDGARAVVFRVHKDGLPERINIGATGPIPDVQDLGLRSDTAGLTELQSKVESRDDAQCHPMSRRAVMCHVDHGRAIYTFTEPGALAHPSTLFRGFVIAEDGTPQLQERGWSGADETAAQAFYSSISAWPQTSGGH